MLNYVIDSSVFVPPELPEDEANAEQKKQFQIKLREYLDSIEKYSAFILKSDVIVNIFKNNRFDDIECFNNNYIKKAAKYYELPLDTYKTKLNNIFECNINLNHGRSKDEYYFFDERFNFSFLRINGSNIQPSRLNENDIYRRKNIIGILNGFVYKDSQYMFIILNIKNEPYIINIRNICFNLEGIAYNNEILETEVNNKTIENLIFKQHNFKSVNDAVKEIEKKYSEYIIFGNDVNRGLGTIRENAGPPDRIYAYLETLVKYCKLKRGNEIKYRDDIFLRMLGCINSYENGDRAIAERTLDNGYGNNIVFSLHLKPCTFPPGNENSNRKRTVRIYIAWDNKRNKVIVGWIGRHL